MPTRPAGRSTPPTSQGGALRAQASGVPPPRPPSLDGALLRINPNTGAAAAGNPRSPTPTPAPPDRRLRLPQPVPLHVPPRHGRALVGDAGWNTWEEINRVAGRHAGRNLAGPATRAPPASRATTRWTCQLRDALFARGGRHRRTTPRTTPRRSSPANPAHRLSSSSGWPSTPARLPAAVPGALFFSDYSRIASGSCTPGAERAARTRRTRQTSSPAGAGPVFLTEGPDGELYYADLNGGTIRRIAFDNSAPTARITATPASGTAADRRLRRRASTDPEGQA